MWHKAVFRMGPVAGPKPNTTGSSKNASCPVGIPLFSGCLKGRATNPTPPKRVKAWGTAPWDQATTAGRECPTNWTECTAKKKACCIYPTPNQRTNVAQGGSGRKAEAQHDSQLQKCHGPRRHSPFRGASVRECYATLLSYVNRKFSYKKWA